MKGQKLWPCSRKMTPFWTCSSSIGRRWHLLFFSTGKTSVIISKLLISSWISIEFLEMSMRLRKQHWPKLPRGILEAPVSLSRPNFWRLLVKFTQIHSIAQVFMLLLKRQLKHQLVQCTSTFTLTLAPCAWLKLSTSLFGKSWQR